ncbi:MAG: TetR/AcrR family transcriptional regulator [Actinomycetota bacterium]
MRARLIEAGIQEFADRGFDGASTRAIAEAADAQQSQITYHFGTKDDLWRACVDQMVGESQLPIEDALRSAEVDGDLRRAFVTAIHRLVEFAATRPELHRIVSHEASADSARSRWIAETHSEPRRRLLIETWQRLVDAGIARPIDTDALYHLLLGSVVLLHVHRPEARVLGIDVDDPSLVRRHADAVVALFLGPEPADS